MLLRPAALSAVLILHASAVPAQTDSNDWAVAVLDYAPNGAVPGYTNALHALGPAARMTIGSDYGTLDHVLVFQPSVDVVSIGNGGHIDVLMGTVVTNETDPVHPYGVDLIVYGNAFLGIESGTYSFYASPWATMFSERAEIWVSADTTTWLRVPGRYLDDLLPTQSLDIYGAPSDYLRPVDPALYTNDWLDGTWSYTNTVRAYDGAGGGAGVDLSDLETAGSAPTSLAYCTAVRCIDISGTGRSSELDAVARVADVPEGSACAVLVMVCVALRGARGHLPA